MRYPKFLTKGDKISFVATSFGATTKPYSTRVKYAKRTFEKLCLMTYFESPNKWGVIYISDSNKNKL